MKTNTLTTSILIALALWALPGLAANSELGVGQKRPWARGVSEADQTAAAGLFEQGNAMLENSIFMKAVEKYEEALRIWNHPSIHYNLALALVNLNEPLRLHHHLMEALRYEGQPLDASKLGRLRDLLKVVERQLVRVRLSCGTPGATVQMDGTALFVGPGHHETFVLPGEYTFTVTREGFPPNERKRMGSAGEVLVLDYRLYTQEELTRYHRPWPGWRPWAVVGAGVALSGGGLFLHTRANEKYRLFDEAILRCSSANNGRGCLPSPEMLTDQSRGNTFQAAALGTLSVGGASLALGLTLAYFNRLQAEVISPDDHEKSLNITPVVGSAQNGVAATFSF